MFGDSGSFDSYEEFVPGNIPTPGDFLDADGFEVLEGDAHTEFHRTTRDLFEERKVYDMTFGYNLARLNLDHRHPDAGYRYAENGKVLRAEFTPTTEFCPQSHTLAIGSFRAWNGLSERHPYDLVAVRIADMHHNSDVINGRMQEVEERCESGESAAEATEGAVDTAPGEPVQGPD